MRALAASVELEREIGPATAAVARRLCGRPIGDPGPLAALLFVIADAELRLLGALCGGEPLRACMAAVAWMKHVLPLYGAKPVVVARERSPEPDSLDELRAQLSLLMQRRLPQGFPLPAVPKGAATPLERGIQLARALDVVGAGRLAMEAALACNEVVQALVELMPGFGWDYSVGHLQEKLGHDLSALGDLLQRLPALRRIVDELGRMEAIERTLLRPDAGGRESVLGARIGGELSDVLPCELALLGTSDTEDLFYQRLIERRLLSLELTGVVTETARSEQRRGPAIACIDTSGSMRGAPEAVAKALVLAVARRMARERRPLHVLLFGGPGEATELEIRPGRAGVAGLLQFLRMSFCAGTDYDTPLLRALELLGGEVFKRADVVIITDGLCRASAQVVEKVVEVKRSADARVLGVIIGSETAGLETFSDQLWIVGSSATSDTGLELWRHGKRVLDDPL
ncbi:hypothetical protein OV203_21445 [Nannocystis sp. ILAH1]|uniref:VWA domain-containing protein n=1 Tax=Nannocystis sp. ILAH1 TaxID=2996789 RepID=UPI00226E875E|nr:VWA domain-containing protein [Nannocystis sp. ILAH1]MCY0989717.1 hypothetical protein [Nannocystis sp. ILAH1]